MKIGIIGIGAMGSLFGGAIKLINGDVKLIIRNQKTRLAIENNGLTLNLDNGSFKTYPEIVTPHSLHKFDLILIFTKTNHTEKALKSIQHNITPKTVLMSLQNGIGNEKKLNKFVPLSNIIYGTSMAPADLVKYGEVTSHGSHSSEFKALGEVANNYINKITDLLNKAGLKAYINNDVDQIIWNKVAFNSAMNSICALIRGTPKEILLNPRLKIFVEKVAEETCRVAKSIGINVNELKVKKTIELSCKEHGDHKPSMLQDFLAKKLTEIDSLNGSVIKIGKENSINTPLNTALYNLIKAEEMFF